MNVQLEKMKDVLKMDLSIIVQKVSFKHRAYNANVAGGFFLVLFFKYILGQLFYRFSLTDLDLRCPLHPQGFSSLNDTPHMVTEQTRSVVESKFWKHSSFFYLFCHLFSNSVFRPFVDTDGLIEQSVTQMCRV